ncbi:MAG: molybdopterin-dependent oxidoreductase [Firmicutes bacterium]|nr:molybdopterin-dependent oxidoreductase [Bacillota bacterium]
MQRKLIYLTGIILAAVVLYLGITGNWLSDSISDQEPDSVSQATENRYKEMEIRDYEGVRLDPSIGPRDNSISGIQQVDPGSYNLSITGLVEKPLAYSYDQILENDSYQRLITLYCVEGWDATVLWEGVRITDLLEDAEVLESGEIAIFHCVDGYTTSLPLETIKERDMLLAYSSNGITLPDSLGFPFIVIAEDKLGYKWARWVTEIEISADLEYKGYWESRGYTNDAEVRR